MRGSVVRIEACFRGLKSRVDQIKNRAKNLEVITSQLPEEASLMKLEANVCELADFIRNKNLKLIRILEEDEADAEEILQIMKGIFP